MGVFQEPWDCSSSLPLMTAKRTGSMKGKGKAYAKGKQRAQARGKAKCYSAKHSQLSQQILTHLTSI